MSAAGSISLINPLSVLSSNAGSNDGYGIHPFIENNPDAVFIMRTEVSSMDNSAEKLVAGTQFAQHVFVPKSTNEGGFSLNQNLLFKPNLTCRYSTDIRYTVEGTMGIQTDCYFVEGLINRLRDLGMPGQNMAIRETNCPEDFDDGGYISMAERTGISVADRSLPIGQIPEDHINWIDVPKGVFFNRIPYLSPTNRADTPLINIAKFKTHAMGVTGCAKNIQGLNALPYVRHCTEYYNQMDVHPDHIQPGAMESILENYNRRKDTVPRWDRPERNGGLWQETWATRCLDNNSVTKPMLNIIEGIYGRDGHFINGPHSGLAKDHLSNILIFGINPFHVDNIAHWLAGHEPGNFGLFHMAYEREMMSIVNPLDIPLYEWKKDGQAEQAGLGSFQRTPLKTMYLTKDYKGQTEDRWHLVNEPFDYSVFNTNTNTVPSQLFELHQNYPNPSNLSTSIEYSLNQAGHASLEVFDMQMKLIEKLVDRNHGSGSHLVVWKTANKPAGQYFYRLAYQGFSDVKSLLIIH